MSPLRLELEWEEGIFRGLRALWRGLGRQPSTPFDETRAARLEDHRAALTVLAQAISGEPLRLKPARGVGGARGLDLLLPELIDLADDPQANRDFYVVRTAISATIHSRYSQERAGSDSFTAVLEGLRAAHEAAIQLEEELPLFGERHRTAISLALAARPPLAGFRGRERMLEEIRRAALRGDRPWENPDLSAQLAAARSGGPESPGIPIWGELIAEVGATAPETDEPAEQTPPPGPGTEIEAPPVDEVRRVELDPREQEDAVLIHSFEKVETADSYQGGARDTDGSDELLDHLEALEDVDLGEVMRGGAEVQSMLRADLQMDSAVPDVASTVMGERGVPYDEWDFRARAYRKDWCVVYPTPVHAIDPAWPVETLRRHRRVIDDLRKRLAIHRSEYRPKDRQLDGEEIDLAAIVDEYGAARAGHGENARLYVREEKRRRDFATTVLLDVSLSTDSWVANQRVLDVARDAVLVLGEVAADLDDAFQVLAFASHTRNRCRVWELKGWSDPWEVGRKRLAVLDPQGYTRIGPALRHATAELAQTVADRRLLLLVSDGKPTDYDRYEGRYGVADVRQALREAEARGICVHALAVDAVARDYLPAMFGPGAWHILPRPDHLPRALTTVYGRLTSL
ncbi:MAG: hypothetical protein GY937_02100 [bacterium]|nr:hypothetical protein [bacterium]